jgi:hypothetical protein
MRYATTSTRPRAPSLVRYVGVTWLGNKLLGPHHNDSVSQLGTRRMNYIQLTDITTNGAKLENGK